MVCNLGCGCRNLRRVKYVEVEVGVDVDVEIPMFTFFLVAPGASFLLDQARELTTCLPVSCLRSTHHALSRDLAQANEKYTILVLPCPLVFQR